MHLETERLIVRDLMMEDVDAVHHLLDHDLKYDDLTRERRAQWVQWSVLNYAELGRLYQPPYGERGVFLKATGELIGLAGLVPAMMSFGMLPYYQARVGGAVETRNIPEMGLFWAIASAHQRKGYATEAGRALIQFAFEALQLRRVIATTEYDNEASIGVMRRLGMTLDKNPNTAPFWMQVVGILENPASTVHWPSEP